MTPEKNKEINYQNEITSLTELIKMTKDKGKKVLICGNGGSACNAIHFAEDLQNRGIRAMHLCDIGYLTANANDFGYKYVFSNAIKLWGEEDDLLLTLSCSGKSENVIEALQTAMEMGLRVYTFPTNEQTKKITPFTEDVHLQIIHGVYANFL